MIVTFDGNIDDYAIVTIEDDESIVCVVFTDDEREAVVELEEDDA